MNTRTRFVSTTTANRIARDTTKEVAKANRRNERRFKIAQKSGWLVR